MVEDNMLAHFEIRVWCRERAFEGPRPRDGLESSRVELDRTLSLLPPEADFMAPETRLIYMSPSISSPDKVIPLPSEKWKSKIKRSSASALIRRPRLPSFLLSNSLPSPFPFSFSQDGSLSASPEVETLDS